MNSHVEANRLFTLPLALLFLTSCERVRLQVPSPDGQLMAEVRSHWTIDPPLQSLWLRHDGAAAERLAELAADSEWCDQVIWTQDTARVAFLINGVRLDVYDVEGMDLVRRVPLVAVDGYPGSKEVRALRFAPDGRAVQFRECRRSRPECEGVRTVPLG